MKHILRALCVVAILFSYSSFAQAAPQGGVPSGPNGNSQDQGGPPSGGGPREACRSDAMTFCRGVQPGGGRIKDCLEDHYKQLSDACYNALKNAPPGPPQQRGASGGGQGRPPAPPDGGPNDDGADSQDKD